MVLVAAEQGYARATVGEVCARARVSRATFYAAFEGLEDCFLAVIDDGHERAQALVTQAFTAARCWQDGIRGALVSLLVFLEEEPRLARVWFVETLAAGAWALERRERHIAALTKMILAYWPLPEEARTSPFAAAAVMECVLGTLHTRLLTADRQPLLELLGPLMGVITAIYLGEHSAASEVARCERIVRRIVAEREREPWPVSTAPARLPLPLENPRAHRARGCLAYLAEHPGASNRQVASAIGINSQAQISGLLARLAREGLLHKHTGRPGLPNAWTLTSYARQALDENTINTYRTPDEATVNS